MIYKKTFQAMGCHMQAILDSDLPYGKRRLDQVPSWFEEWESCLSRFRADSELSLLNQLGGREVAVSSVLWEVFQLAVEMEHKSDGLVTPVVLDALETAGYVQSFEQLSGSRLPPNLKMRTPTPKLSSVEHDAITRSIYLPPGLRLDFGGIAKGWAAHTAMQKLKLYAPVLIDAGGDIAISGLRSGGEPWPVGITDPRNPGEQLMILKLGKCGVATSGVDYRRWKQGDTWQHHIIDPRSGEPAQTDILSATVVAPSVKDAEMAAKAVLVLGSQDGLNWLDNHNGFEGMLAHQDGRVSYSKKFSQYIWE